MIDGDGWVSAYQNGVPCIITWDRAVMNWPGQGDLETVIIKPFPNAKLNCHVASLRFQALCWQQNACHHCWRTIQEYYGGNND